ncbi:MAG TPA: glycosyltransferase family 4 protein [Anaerolineales bacterium]|nr:glycosyltransferase family 4 protein [Anaerolineales bacterium]
MKILYFSKNYTPHDHRFLSSLSQTEHEVFFLQLEANKRQTEDRPVPENIRQILWADGRGEFRWRDMPRLVVNLRRVINEVRPNLIHAGPIQTCAFLAALSGFRPILTMSWGYDLMQDADRDRWMQWITRYTLKRSAFFTSDAQVTCDKAVAFGMDPERTIIFPWGIDLKHFHPKSARRKSTNQKISKSPNQQITLFCSRTWEPIYGVDVLAKAFVKVAADRPNVNLILLGGGSQGTKLRQILMRGGVLERVHFGGQIGQKELPRWYHMSDLYISPSHVDGSSVSLMEALASGLPCLVSDIPGNREWVEDGVNGWLFRDGDVDDLAEKILYALKNRRSFKRIGEAARQTAEQKADWQKNFGKLLEAYNRISSLRGR